jgi:hypothetical protein
VRGARRVAGHRTAAEAGVGFFGGEGFIMQKLEGDGLAFVHAGGTVVKRELQPGQTLLVDTGCVVAYTPNVNFEIQYVGKIKTALFGGEGLFFANLAHRPRARVAAEPAVQRAWPRGCLPRRRSAAARARKARCSAAGGRRPAGRASWAATTRGSAACLAPADGRDHPHRPLRAVQRGPRQERVPHGPGASLWPAHADHQRHPLQLVDARHQRRASTSR